MQARVRAKFKEQPPKVMLLASDTDADWIGASLMKALRLKNPEVLFCGTGGRLMAHQGLLEACTMRAAHVGTFQVLQRRQVVRQILRQALIERPDILIVLNTSYWAASVARWMKQHTQTKVFFYDAGGPHLIKGTLEKFADVTFDALPHRTQAGHIFIGHPIFEKFAEYIPTGEAKPISKTGRIALMPSAYQTVKQMQHMSKVVEVLRNDFPRLEVVIPLEDGHNPRSFEPFAYLAAQYVRGPEKYTALGTCDAALASKDDSNLDMVALGVPMVLLPKFGFKADEWHNKVLKGQPVSPLLDWDGAETIPTTTQDDNVVEALLQHVNPLLRNTPERKAQLMLLAKMRKALVANKKTASVTAAAEVLGK